MAKLLKTLTPALLALLAATSTLAAGDHGALTTRPVGYKPLIGDSALGEKLFNDSKLSTNGLSCASCHANGGAFQASFVKPYPHTVAMARDQLGHKAVYLDEMVQGCMVMPMAARPLLWYSKELAALTAYTASLQKSFRPAQ